MPLSVDTALILEFILHSDRHVRALSGEGEMTLPMQAVAADCLSCRAHVFTL